MKRKICIVTATRADYAPLRWIIEDVQNDAQLELQLVVTGAHLSHDHGHTYDEILKDGFVADELVEMPLNQGDKRSLVESMGHCQIGMAGALERLKPDLLLVLGDRYELLPICSAAVVMNIPIAHISGGDLTEGAIDEQVRHAVSKMALLHFPGTMDSAQRLIQMGESPERVFAVGEPGLDGLHRGAACSRSEVAGMLGLSVDLKWILFTYHPETMGSITNDVERVNFIVDFLLAQESVHLIATGANADSGGAEINRLLQQLACKYQERFCFRMNLGSQLYFQLLRHVSCIVGNSSSGIIEAPALKVPVLNIGDRQKGRFLCGNIVNCESVVEDFNSAYRQICSDTFLSGLHSVETYYGDGETAPRIVKILREFPLQSIRKVFYKEVRFV